MRKKYNGEEIAEKYRDGWSLEDLMWEFDIKRKDNLKALLKRNGCEILKKNHYEAEAEDYEQMAKDGISGIMKYISNRCNHDSTLLNAINNFGKWNYKLGIEKGRQQVYDEQKKFNKLNPYKQNVKL